MHQTSRKDFTYRKALCDGHLNVEEEDSGFKSSTDPNRLFGMAEHAADAGGEQIKGFGWKAEQSVVFKTAYYRVMSHKKPIRRDHKVHLGNVYS